MKENKGFTLIELLAVIVILAIIALIATPVIMKIINDSRKSAAVESAKLMVSQAELAYNAAYLQCGGNPPTILKIVQKYEGDGVKVLVDNEEINDDTAVTEDSTYTLTDGFDTTCELSNESDNLKISCSTDNTNFATDIAGVKETSGSMSLGTCTGISAETEED